MLKEDGICLAPTAHILDLADCTGTVLPHVDSREYVGRCVIGLSLLTPSIMRLQSCTHPSQKVSILLPQRSLYLMRRSVRYDYTHALDGGRTLQWRGDILARNRRVAILFRDPPFDSNES